MFGALLAAWIGVAAAAPPGEGYQVRETLTLRRAVHGIDGLLELLEDARITADLRDAMWRMTRDPVIALDNGDPAATASFEATAVRPAVVRLVDPAGRVLDSRDLEVPLATFDTGELGEGVEQPTVFAPGRPAVLVTADWSTGVGHAAGPATRLATVAGGKLQWEAVVEAKTGKVREIVVGSGLWNDWQLERRKGGADILAVSCFCAGAQPETTYTRYRVEAGRWTARARTEKAAWTADEEFPPRRKFPR